MKRFVCMLLTWAMVVSLCACGAAKAPVEEDVTVTLPADLLALDGTEVTQEDLDQTIEEEGWKSATLNEDGSITYVMTKEKHEEMLQEVRGLIDEAIAEMTDSGDYSNIVSVEPNDDYSQFTVTLNTDEVGLMESIAVLGLYIYGAMYQTVNGAETDNINVQFVNADTGEVIEEANSSDLG